MKYIILTLTLVALMTGCSVKPQSKPQRSKIEPLTNPTKRQVNIPGSSQRMPSFEMYTCPIHRRTVDVVVIKGETYCHDCLWERVLEISNEM